MAVNIAINAPPEHTSDAWASRFPSAYTILFTLIAIVAAMTWIVPAGQYEHVQNEELGREVAVLGTYAAVESEPQGITDVIFAPIKGFYDPGSYEANAIDVSLFVLGGTTYGMAEETLAFYMLIIPIMIAAGYDALTGVAIIMLGAGIGVLGSTINPFATTIASNAAGIPFTQGIVLRIGILVVGWLFCVAYVMRYAEKVRKNPDSSIVARQTESNRKHFAMTSKSGTVGVATDFGFREKIILVLFALTFGVMIWGVSSQGWWMAEMSALFLAGSLVVGVVGWMGEKVFVEAFVNGAKDLLGVALIIGIARGIVVIMDAGNITDTILFWSENAIGDLSSVAYINAMYWIEILMSFFVPSTSGLAVLSMPVLAPLSDFAGVSRDLSVTAYQSASGIVNLVTPTSAVVIGGLAIGRVGYDKWLRFIWPVLLVLTLIVSLFLSLGAM